MIVARNLLWRFVPAWLVLAAAGLLPILLPIPANAADWKPDKRVEIIVPSGPGGGNDRVARLEELKGILTELGLVKPP